VEVSAVLHRRVALFLGLLSLLIPLEVANAQDVFGKSKGKGKREAVAEAAQSDAKPASTEPIKEVQKTTQHVITVDGTKIEYTATAGNLLLKDDEGKTKASIFFVAYTKNGVGDLSKRPIMFVFNGGPGSSAVWLHLGAFGPRRVLVGKAGEPLPPPYRLVDNENTLLDQTDLVFIDPVSTGYSRPGPGQAAKQFHGVQGDIQSVGDFIQLYASRYQRWGSPKFVAGESYGTTRAAGLSSYLQDQNGLNLNGVILISTVLNHATLRFDEGNDLPYPLFLPTYTATAWYHKKLPSDLQMDRARTLKEVEEFALGPYTAALMKGNKLRPEERQEIVHKLVRYTGLSEDFVRRANLRIQIGRFTEELLRDRNMVVGRYDSRYKGLDLDALSPRAGYDPSYTAVQGAFTATLNQYLEQELHYKSDRTYEILTGRVQPWDYGNAKNRYLNVATSLEQAMVKNPYLRVFQANGYYDLATPFFATEYTFNHMEPAQALAGRVAMGYYEAGHMMYLHGPSHHKLKRDLTDFIQAAVHETPVTDAVGR
jgi:carboxypeptidase C (cathepsin A)